MAQIQGIVSVGFVDAYGITATVPFNITVDDTKTVAQLMTDVGALASDTEALSQANEYRTTISLVLDPGGAITPGAGDIEKGALFNFANATDAYLQGILVPDVNPSILNGAGLVNLTNADVVTWVTFLTTAHTAITVVTKGVRALSGLVDALISFRKHRKPLTRKTKEIS